jgi:hypothetical protein
MLAYIFVLVAVALRFLPHAFSFSPVGAAFLFFGATAPPKRAWIPLAILACSDIYLTLFHYEHPVVWDQFITWAWYGGMIWLGSRLRHRRSPARILGASVASAVSFFVVTNFAVWAAMDLYPHTLAGLWMSYAAGIPFFRMQLLADPLFLSVMFGIAAFPEVVRTAFARRAAV